MNNICDRFEHDLYYDKKCKGDGYCQRCEKCTYFYECADCVYKKMVNNITKFSART